MKRYFAGAVVALMLCLTAGWTYAEYAQAGGVIKSIDVAGGKLVVTQGRDANAKEITYAIDKDTSVTVNRDKKALADLAAGNFVQIFFKEADKAGDLPKALLLSVRTGGPGAGGGRGGRGGAGGGGN